MQSFTYYYVSEFLKDRHPYIPPEKEVILIDPEQVTIAYNERCIPKLAALLVYPELNDKKRRDALHTLNELVSHQESKTEMIENDIVYSACNLMASTDWEVRREAAMLIGSLMFLDVGRNAFNTREGNFTILQNIILDENVEVRKASSWLLYRLAIHKDGVQMLVDSATAIRMVDAFNFYSNTNSFDENFEFLVYLLESFILITMYDFGIMTLLGKSLLRTFNFILRNDNNMFSKLVKKGYFGQMRELLLITLKNVTLIQDGKIEAISNDLVYTTSSFLTSEYINERLHSTSFMMSISNILEGKKQICSHIADAKFIILEKLCSLLVINPNDPKYETNLDIKSNSKLSLQIISEFPEGFLKIVEILHDKINVLDEVFEVRAVKGLSELLPKIRRDKTAPYYEKENIQKYFKYGKGIYYFVKKYENALDILIHETVDIGNKLAPFLLYSENKNYNYAYRVLRKINTVDSHNNVLIQAFCQKNKLDYKQLFTGSTKDGNDSLHESDI